MTKTVFGILLFVTPFFLFSQSLTRERIERLKKTVVKITISRSNSSGTGFFITTHGAILTCWHVIDPALIKDSLGHILSVKDIFVATPDGRTRQYFIPSSFYSDEILNIEAVSKDFCFLVPKEGQNEVYPCLKLGKFEDIEEGGEVYTAGYPLGINYQFVSRGILSTKFIDTSLTWRRPGMPDIIMRKSVALLDLTLNKGNSGGPIIKLGATPNDDVVVGIASFLINPLGTYAEQLNEKLNKDNYNLSLPTGVSLTESLKLFSNAIIYSANGISGCVSINHSLQVIK